MVTVGLMLLLEIQFKYEIVIVSICPEKGYDYGEQTNMLKEKDDFNDCRCYQYCLAFQN